MGVFEMIRENISARQVAEFYGIRVGRNGMACCPFHNDRRPSMKLDRRFHCFGCQADGDAVDFVSKYFDINLMDAVGKICCDFGLQYDKRSHDPPPTNQHRKPVDQVFAETEQHCFKVLCDYLHQLEKWKNEYAPKDENDDWHPYFCEALQEIPRVEYLLDILLTGGIPERAFLISDYGGRVIKIERRLKELGS